MIVHLIFACLVLALPRLWQGQLHWWLMVGPLTLSVAYSYGSQYAERALLLLLVVGVAFLARRGFKDAGLPLRAALWGLPIYMAVIAWSQPGGSGGIVLYIASTLVFLLVGWRATPIPKRDTLFLLTCALVSLSVLSGLAEGVIVARKSTSVERSVGFFTTNGGANLAGVFSALTLVICLAMLARVRAPWHRFLVVVVSLLSVAALVSTLSRRALIAAGVAAVLAFIGRKAVRRTFAATLLVGAPLVALVGVGAPALSLFQNLEMRFSRTGEDAAYRGSEWQKFDGGTFLQQWLGGGIDHGKYVFSEGGLTTFIPVHNSYLYALLAFGLVGAVWLIAVIVLSVIRGVRLFQRTSGSEQYAATLALVVVAISSYFGEAFILGTFSATVWVAIGAIHKRDREENERGLAATTVAG